jgi:hypothetical protein
MLDTLLDLHARFDLGADVLDRDDFALPARVAAQVHKIEHNLDVIKTADWLIDLGPEGGDAGGMLVGCGTPEQLAALPSSHTGSYLKAVLARGEDSKQ